MEFRQLLPESEVVDGSALLAGMELSRLASDERPYVAVNFVSSVDGRATFQGRSGQLGDAADRFMFHGLRENVDAVFAGTGTLRSERYGPIIRDADGLRRREQAGLPAEPLACVVTRSGDVPFDIPLFTEPRSRIVVFSGVPVDVTGCPAQVELVQLDPAELTLTMVLRHLRRDFGVGSLLCEGGPTVFGAMLHEYLVDELFLTLAPKLVGGTEPSITAGPELKELQPTNPVWALEHDGALYLRYRLL